MSPVKRTSHAVYDLKYHFVWIPKYRKRILRGEIAEIYEFEIETMAVVEDHVHIFLSALPKYAPGEVVRILGSRSAKAVFEEFSQVRMELWAGELWSDGYFGYFGYFVRRVGDKVTTESIKPYIEYYT